MPTATAPRRFEITFTGDTEQLRQHRPEAWDRHIAYHLQRIFTGEPVALEELEHYGLTAVVREQLAPETAA
jgi:hypothetical protein